MARESHQTPPVFKVGLCQPCKQKSQRREAAAGIIPVLLSSGSLPQGTAALKGKEEHTLFKEPGKVP